MNRRRTVKAHLGLGSILLMIVAALIISAAGVFYAYIKNRQISVAREIQRTEERISQHDLDIKTTQMLLAEQLNPFLLRDRLREFNSDLRRIPHAVVSEVEPLPPGSLSPHGGEAEAGSPSETPSDPSRPAAPAVARLARGGP